MAKGRHKSKGFFRIRGKVPVRSNKWNNFYEHDLNPDGSLKIKKEQTGKPVIRCDATLTDGEGKPIPSICALYFQAVYPPEQLTWEGTCKHNCARNRWIHQNKER